MAWTAPKEMVEKYVALVKYCLIDNDTFATFKSHKDYKAIVGMSTVEQTPYFWRAILDHPDVFQRMLYFQLNDIIGKPNVHNYGWYSISPNTLRHVFSLTEIIDAFPDLKTPNTPISVSELGVGYGAMAFVLSAYYDIKQYQLVDMPEVQQLAMKYLGMLNVKNLTVGTLSAPDLFISEYCWTEFDHIMMENFYQLLIKDAKRFYIRSNIQDESQIKYWAERMSKDFNVQVQPERPPTIWPNNKVFIGSK